MAAGYREPDLWGYSLPKVHLLASLAARRLAREAAGKDARLLNLIRLGTRANLDKPGALRYNEALRRFNQAAGWTRPTSQAEAQRLVVAQLVQMGARHGRRS